MGNSELREVVKLGLCALQQGDLGRAENAFANAIGFYPAAPLGYYHLGATYYRQQRYAEAESAFAKVLVLDKYNVDALIYMGLVLHAQMRYGDAIVRFRKVLKRDPSNRLAAYNLGNSLLAFGSNTAAANVYRKLLLVHPDDAECWDALGKAEAADSAHESAVACFRKALALRPDCGRYHHDLGASLTELGISEEAEREYLAALTLDPGLVEAANNLGALLIARNRAQEGEVVLREAASRATDFGPLLCNWGIALAKQRRFKEALTHFLDVLEQFPNEVRTLNNVGGLLIEVNNYPEAEKYIRQALALAPESAQCLTNLGRALEQQGKFLEAERTLRKAVACSGSDASEKGAAQGYLAGVLVAPTTMHESERWYQKAIETYPNEPACFSNYLFSLNYRDDVDSDHVYALHREWNRRYALPLQPQQQRHSNRIDAQRRLRIGYVSPDFRAHSVAYFVDPLLRGHDRREVEVFCYANVPREDTFSARLKRQADVWRDIFGLDDEQVAARIRDDEIDILVDLTGHTGHHRLTVFAHTPAPIQVTYLGYPNTTGLTAMDYRLTDGIADPPQVVEEHYSEKLYRLPGGFLCYSPPEETLRYSPGVPPMVANGYVTFASFNNSAKLSPGTIHTWARLLLRVPESRLLLKSKPLQDLEYAERIWRCFEQAGLPRSRVEVLGWCPFEHHFGLYQRVDIALDPFPYNGTTTTCETLWMGVPVLTLRGERHAARVGASLLHQVGLDEWVADSVDEYIDLGVNYASDVERLFQLRESLREHLSRSALFDAQQFVPTLEAAYREMWREWCWRCSAAT